MLTTTRAPRAARRGRRRRPLHLGNVGTPKGALVPHARELDGPGTWRGRPGAAARGRGRLRDPALARVRLHLPARVHSRRRGRRAHRLDGVAPAAPRRGRRRRGATVLHGSPRLFASLLDAAPEGLPGVRTGFVAGSPSPPGLLERLDASACGSSTSTASPRLGAVSAAARTTRPTSATRPPGVRLPGLELRIVPRTGSSTVLQPVPRRRDPRPTRLRDLRRARRRLPAHRRAVERLVNVGGFNVFPAEVGDRAARPPERRGGRGRGCRRPATGEALHAFVVARAGTEVDRADLLRFARAQIAGL